jgi:hypothetical protein
MTGGYRLKSPEQLAWNKIKRAAQAQATFEAATFREARLNDILGELWPKFTESLLDGKLLELSDGSAVITDGV